MIDTEVERLRRLRSAALRVRSIAHALGDARPAAAEGSARDPLLHNGACAAWRVARAASGRLRAHPYARFQQDPGMGVVVANGFVAANAVIGVRSRHQALLRFAEHLKALMREVEDVRALTWADDFGDCLGRSQLEMRTLLGALEYETRGSRLPERSRSASIAAVARYTGTGETDWPYLAF